MVEYILDRNACLLPAYFAVTEIRKLYPEGQLSHWVSGWFCVCLNTHVQLCHCLPNTFVLQLLGSLISDFVDSFRPTARINSICGETLRLLCKILTNSSFNCSVFYLFFAGVCKINWNILTHPVKDLSLTKNELKNTSKNQTNKVLSLLKNV